MTPRFNIRGLLFPYKIIKFSWDEFERFFVLEFPEKTNRRAIFENFKHFIERFKQGICPKFYIWVDGSFTTNKPNPADIDVVFFIDHSICAEKEPLIRRDFFTDEIKHQLKIDAYLVRVYPEKHKKHYLFHLDMLNWKNIYGTTRPDERTGFEYSKGIVQLNFT